LLPEFELSSRSLPNKNLNCDDNASVDAAISTWHRFYSGSLISFPFPFTTFKLIIILMVNIFILNHYWSRSSRALAHHFLSFFLYLSHEANLGEAPHKARRLESLDHLKTPTLNEAPFRTGILITIPTGVRLNSFHASEFALQFVPGFLLSSLVTASVRNTSLQSWVPSCHASTSRALQGTCRWQQKLQLEGLRGYVPAMCQALCLSCVCLQRSVPTRSRTCMLIIEEGPDARVTG
jgi:hypothetical protein